MGQILLFGWLGVIVLKFFKAPVVDKLEWKYIILAPLFYALFQVFMYLFRYIIVLAIFFGVIYWICEIGIHV